MVEEQYFERRDPARNMARFYALSLEADLFGGLVFVRRFGRIGGGERVMREAVADRLDGARRLAALAAQKARRGYRPPPVTSSPAPAPAASATG